MWQITKSLRPAEQDQCNVVPDRDDPERVPVARSTRAEITLLGARDHFRCQDRQEGSIPQTHPVPRIRNSHAVAGARGLEPATSGVTGRCGRCDGGRRSPPDRLIHSVLGLLAIRFTWLTGTIPDVCCPDGSSISRDQRLGADVL